MVVWFREDFERPSFVTSPGKSPILFHQERLESQESSERLLNSLRVFDAWPIFNEMSDVATILGLVLAVTGCGLKLTGLRVGPMRALVLAYKSVFFGRYNGLQSIRTIEKAKIQYRILQRVTRNVANDSYTVVVGDKGADKTCLIDTALVGTKGVIRVKVSPAMKQNDIIETCEKFIIGPSFCFYENPANVNRVLYWYNRFFNGQMPVVVLIASERTRNATPAELTGAVRHLCDLGLHVIVDASPNSFPENLVQTTREFIVEVGDLSAEPGRSVCSTSEAELVRICVETFGRDPFEVRTAPTDFDHGANVRERGG
jgi:hypothetical protein